jgi:hypothetical protein
MAKPLKRSKVQVEGKDDLYSLVELLKRHGVRYDAVPWPANLPEFETTGGIDELLAGIETAVELSSNRSVGFVLDADAPRINRWRAVRDRLVRVDVAAPKSPPPDGFVGTSTKYKSTVGVWLMPDNQRDGTLEDFLRMLIDEGDRLIDYAKHATKHARDKKGAPFPAVQQDKAVIHTWLAWQETPGLPYGSAVAAHFFRHDTPAALAFVAWFKRLFAIA